LTALFPGSFDPVTLGHADIIGRASRLFDELIVAVMDNANKKTSFTADERVRFIERSVGDLPNVKVLKYSGLLSDCFLMSGSDIIIRGLRSCAEFERELDYARAFCASDRRVETLFIPSDPRYAFISSSMSKEAAVFGGDLHLLLPDGIIVDVCEKFFSGGL